MRQVTDSVKAILGKPARVARTEHPLTSASLCLLSASLVLATPVTWAADVAAQDDNGLAEIVVTAQKYKSTIQNTPISMSALSGDQLTAAGITSVVDVSRDVPGLSVRSAGPGLTEFEARGLASNGGASPTVGFYLDEVPLSPPALSQSGKVVIDPNLYDLERVEVLRGPQGTLYGSGSMGGTIKIVTNQPKLGVVEGSVQGTLSDTQGGSANASGNAMINLPLGEKMALRVVVSDLHRSGWIDRVVVNPFPANGATRGDVLATAPQSVAKNVNTEDLYGGRASLLYKPNENLSITASALYQRLTMGGYDLVDSPPGASHLAHYQAFDLAEPITDTAHVYSLTINAHLGFADLTSASSYWDRNAAQAQDASESISTTLGTPLVPVLFSEADPSHQFSQELRLTSANSDRLHWTVGAFYSNLTSSWNEFGANEQLASTPGFPYTPNGVVFSSINPYNIKQTALFADGSYKLTDELTLSGGLRWYSYNSQVGESEWGLVAPVYRTQPPSPVYTTASDKGYNPRVNLSYQPTATLNTYLTAAKGFRPGGANIAIPPSNQPPFCAGSAPTSFGPDSVWNYEVGEKAKFLNNRLSINSDVYYIKWNGVQQSVPLACGFVYNTNAGDGYSYGPELEINGKINDSWTVSLNGAITEAKIDHPTQAYASSLIGTNGQPYCPATGSCSVPILNVPHETAALAVQYATQISEGYELNARLSDTYTGGATDLAYYFGVNLPSYSLLALRATISHNNWSAALFADNLTNKVALITANNTQFQFNIPQLIRYSMVQPRTIGTQINYRF